MVLSTESLMAGIGILGSGCMAFGVVKGMMSNKVDYSTHRAICDAQKKETVDKIDSVLRTQSEIFGMVMEIHGFLKAKGNDSI